MELLVAIGAEEGWTERLRSALDARVVTYPAPPPTFSIEGSVYVESATVAGRWLRPHGIFIYGYFDDAAAFRRALALAATPTFPDVRRTLPLDERALALVAATLADGSRPPRGFVPAGVEVSFEREHVLKWGSRHCGEDKARASGRWLVEQDAIVEPFFDGRSERVLVVGGEAWHLRYESDDWRKNVRAKVAVIDPDAELVARARRICASLGLEVAGVDFVVTPESAYLLEVNAYPGLDDVPAAADALVALTRRWWSSIPTSAPSGDRRSPPGGGS